ncbi:MAG TPA: bifunctional proline dehydrogenase/L-glutamate gamma-semialdehyde dehydrogenase [Gordonia sp. (in: high G+C Gram-positive bacteria)]|uniref:bifunctional proline dehydrogenase/L-glutamate gamma-semialdehyde dehydrogenase n=1 Tax=unclassified Gordonia (in: high G+C Gram-positive bacteria) TaxID=2657482 RepID=UPI0025C0A242|nr:MULTISPECIES: bifunctional proline dehydrogenase/L-glutamate gamma-semialdehyde dehydrogenase [unclassified Gordonia (in: high G+C Gram-positive bacteria)]HNP55471.1 bifunctional proline dehydrogenase/L-glutamate gamma-semialdehyde dehydrogenase [Gordonia sp. (in: high G+C Gram-positive bacteria)]HRC50112.1 bifunctional proline dehydrogenase/L-glutamate gamma-semialdehyde dehydrogenase [Gordonia sp. (in: high G+C Gram-positive bacteria)]
MAPLTPNSESYSPSIAAELADLDSSAEALVSRWLQTTATLAQKPHPSAQRLAAILADPKGLDFTVGFVDCVIGIEDDRAAATALAELTADLPTSLNALDRAQLRLGGAMGRIAPRVVIPVARARMRSMVGHMIVDARDRQFTRTVAKLRRGGHRLNINPLGEAVLGDGEADRHLEQARALLRRDDVDYVSIKVSSVASQISMWAYDETVDYVLERLEPMYLEAAAAPAGTKFINLDMEEYRDLNLTVEVFTRLLSHPELHNYEGGIVLQAYLPDALGAMNRLAEFAADRVSRGGAGIKVRLVKGANLAMEKVHAEMADWPLVTCDSKLATDVNYKRVLFETMRPEVMTALVGDGPDRAPALRLGVAGHNLFDIAFAHLLSEHRGVTDHIEFEMLHGMATEQAQALSSDVGRLLLYVPTVAPTEFDVAISYLVRRLEENAASENFMSGIFDLAPGSDAFVREAGRFHSAVEELGKLLATNPPVPGANDHQDRAAQEQAPLPELPAVLPPFDNEPDTNAALPANQAWAREAITMATTAGWLDTVAVPAVIADDEVDDVIATARAAAVDWAARPAAERAAILERAADLLASRRGRLMAIAAAEAGKSPEQSDPEISEAIDFARYYARRAMELDEVDGARFSPDRLIVVAPPWNFPIAIPAGGTFAALAVGAAVIHKPAAPTPRCAMAVLEALWEAGVPREVCVGMFPDEGPAGKRLLSHPQVDRVILTGASETAALFASWRPELAINAETSGKNALVITPAADRDLAIADLVHSAFGHAGQKCSAASLGILVGAVYNSARFRRQLIDAASSLVVDWPSNMKATVGPLTEPPSEKLLRALTTLEPGESWLLQPRQLDDTGRLWSPGIKDGVAPGSFFHRTEVFGPVLGLMRATDIDEALALQNATDFGLTAGVHSRDITEVNTWLDHVQAGNLYVNRGITGAIVRRQPFGGWKRSSVGLGSKAGGPNYVMLLGSWSDAPHVVDATAGSELPAAAAFTADAATVLDEDSVAWVRRAAADDDAAWRAEFGAGRDETGLECEANVFRYRPTSVLVRVGADAAPADLARVLVAAHRAGTAPQVSVSPASSSAVAQVLDLATRHLGVAVTDRGDDAAFATSIGSLRQHRVRLVGSVDDEVRVAVAARPDVALLDDEVTGSGRVELRYWLAEQAVSITLHRFGNPDPAFHTLAAELTGSAS